MTTNYLDFPTVHVLWTGGFDSSFRLVQLSKYQVNVQPYYVKDNRLCEANELAAIAGIYKDIESNLETQCRLHPLKIYQVSEIEEDVRITESFKRLRAETGLGTQYDWLARLAKQIPGLELGLEKANSSIARKCIDKFGKVKKVTEGDISFCILDGEHSSKDLINVFGQFHFPLPLFEKTKLEILQEYKKLGYEQTIRKTWFCHRPINNEPCGFCNPCVSTMQEGMGFRLSAEGRKRYKYRLFYRTKSRLLGAAKRFIMLP